MSTDQSKEKLLFYETLIEVYEVPIGDQKMWGFTLFFDNKVESPNVVCNGLEGAVSSAKLHALDSFVRRSPQLRWLTVYQSDEVFLPSPSVIKRFGDITQWRVVSLYHKRSDRADFLQKIALEGTASSPVKMFSLDGEPIQGILTSSLIERGEDAAILLEEFTLQT
ncbi:MAG TPA: hypothetical protein V6D26_26355 [Stenomitos sp.]